MDAVYQLFISSSTVFNKPLKIFRKAVELCRGNAYNNNMEKEMQNRITADIAAFRLPRYAQIPEVGLYLEQVVRYINARLAPLGEPELTGSMVSNYVKQKLVPAPQKKLYTAEHLARLLFIAVVKPVVPLEGLRLMFSIQEECYPLQTSYDYFCDEFENMLGAAFGVTPAVEGLGETESAQHDLGYRQQGLSGPVSGGVSKAAGAG